jgi:hypothetical protein
LDGTGFGYLIVEIGIHGLPDLEIFKLLFSSDCSFSIFRSQDGHRFSPGFGKESLFGHQEIPESSLWWTSKNGTSETAELFQADVR